MHTQLTSVEPRFIKVIDHLKSELSSMRSGRATPALVEHIKVEAYGTMTPLIELASVTAPEPKLLVVSPWDKSIIKEIEKALQAANLGVQPTVDGTIIRMNFPSLTEERRRELTKLVNNKIEEAKVAIRNVREETMKHLKDEKTSGSITEDDFYTIQKELQKLVDDNNDSIKQIGIDKDKEIMTI